MRHEPKGQSMMKFCNLLIQARSAMVFTVLLLPPFAFAQAPAPNTPPSAAAPSTQVSPTVPVPNAPTAPPPVTSAPNAEIAVKLPRDLTPWGMFLSADIVVKAVMVGLVFASVLTWTIWFAKVRELIAARRRLRTTMKALSEARSLADCATSFPKHDETAGLLVRAAETELRLSADALDPAGVKERIGSRLERIEAARGRQILRGTGLLATIGATAPFVGLFGTVWGIMNSFIGISRQHTTNLAVVAPGIAEALLATALGLVAAIPAVVMYNLFSRWIATYRALQADAAAEVMRLVSRDLDRDTLRLAARRRSVPAE
jgi:biopolymer transport protein ExbB